MLVALPMLTVGKSSLVIVPVPWAPTSVTAIGPVPDVVRFDNCTLKTLSGSMVVSPVTFTVIVPLRLPAGIVSVPLAAV